MSSCDSLDTRADCWDTSLTTRTTSGALNWGRSDDLQRLMRRYAVETHIGTVKSLASQKVGKIPFFLSGGADESIR